MKRRLGHAHSPMGEVAQTTTSRLVFALALTVGFVVIEGLAGYFANSLALLTDAAHNLTDILALALSWYALRLTARPANSGKTFGYHRAGILAALLNSAMLVLTSLGIFYAAYQRLLAPPPVEEALLIGVATLAFLVNAGTAWMIRRGSEDDLNLRSAFVHLAGDAASTLGAVLAGIGIALTGLNALDPLASLLIGALILWNAAGILRETMNILLEGTPRDLDMTAMVHDMLQVQGVRGVHDLHVWSITRNMRAFSAHVLTDDISISAGAVIQRQINALLVHKYGVAHSALQLECSGCEPDGLYCDLTAAGHDAAEHRPSAEEQEA